MVAWLATAARCVISSARAACGDTLAGSTVARVKMAAVTPSPASVNLAVGQASTEQHVGRTVRMDFTARIV